MTTVLADLRYGVMVSDSHISDDDRKWLGRKVFRIRGELYGCAGTVQTWMQALEWIRKGGKPPKWDTGTSLLKLSKDGLFVYEGGPNPERVESGREAIGSGAKAVMCAYEATWFSDPRRAVAIVCKHDACSRGPVRVYRL